MAKTESAEKKSAKTSETKMIKFTMKHGKKEIVVHAPQDSLDKHSESALQGEYRNG